MRFLRVSKFSGPPLQRPKARASSAGAFAFKPFAPQLHRRDPSHREAHPRARKPQPEQTVLYTAPSFADTPLRARTQKNPPPDRIINQARDTSIFAYSIGKRTAIVVPLPTSLFSSISA